MALKPWLRSWLPPYTGKQIGCLVYLAFALFIFASVAIDSYHFDHMTPGEHLAAAEQAQNGDRNAVTDGLKHIAAIPLNARESLATKNLEPVLQARAEQFRETALAARQIQAGQVAAVKRYVSRTLGNRAPAGLGSPDTMSASIWQSSHISR